MKKYLLIHAASALCLALFVYMSSPATSQTATIITTVTTTVTQITNVTRTTTTVFQTTSVIIPITITKANITITTSTTSTTTILIGVLTITQANVTIALPITTTATLSTVTVPTYSYMTVFTPVTFTTYVTEFTTTTATRVGTETVTSPMTFSTTLTATKPLTVTSVSTTTTSVLTRTIVPSFGKCVIASATYGSELAPEVQLLRMFRDQFLLKTFTGSAFMKVFNVFYYSFSPTVAELVSNNPAAGELMRRVLYPLIGILGISSQTYFFFGGSGELAVLIAGLSATLLIGFVYFSPLIMLFSYGVGRRRMLVLKSLLRS